MRGFRTLVVTGGILILLTGCVSPGGVPKESNVVKVTATKGGSSAVRRLMGVYQIGNVAVRTWYLDPLIRPISTVKAGYALVVKTTLGALRRIAVNAVLLRRLERTPLPPVNRRKPMDPAVFERHLNRIGAGTATHGRVDLLIDGNEYFSRLNDVVSNARHSIDVRTYIFDNDDVAVGVADLLKEKSRDVKVRVLLDGLGVWLGEQADSVSIDPDYRPPAAMVSYLRRDSMIKVRVQTNPWFTGDHSKTTIVDGNTAFIGGMNIGREYRHDWHDMMMEVTGPVVGVLEHDADRAWARAGLLGDLAWLGRSLIKRRPPADSDGYPIRVLFTRDHNSQIYRAQLAAARRATSHIYIENPYFSDDLMLYELVRARRRGVDVRVILADQGNHPMMNSGNQMAVNTMLRNGIRVFRFPGMAHVKAAIFDGWACLGSANFDKLSLQVNDEINLASSSPELADVVLHRIFHADLARAREVTALQQISFRNRFAEVVADLIL